MEKWVVDTTHSEVQFKVKHLVISTVTGSFRKFDGVFETESEDFNGSKIEFNVDVNSIDTNQEDRDNHLRSEDFFNVEKYPTMSFRNGELKLVDGEYVLSGDLTIKDVTKNVQLGVDFGGVVTDPYGQVKAGFEITGEVNRKEFGLTWSAVTEAGSVVVGDKVKLSFNIQVVKQ